MALNATTPTTTPAAIPATFGPLLPDLGLSVVVMTVVCACDWPGAVTTMVLACVTTDAVGVLVVVGVGFVELVLEVDVDVSEELESSLELEVSFELELELELEFESEFEFELEPDTLPGLLFSPVKATDHELDPPPEYHISIREQAISILMADLQLSWPYPAHFVLQEESEVLLLTGGSLSPHQQSVPFVVAITALP